MRLDKEPSRACVDDTVTLTVLETRLSLPLGVSQATVLKHFGACKLQKLPLGVSHPGLLPSKIPQVSAASKQQHAEPRRLWPLDFGYAGATGGNERQPGTFGSAPLVRQSKPTGHVQRGVADNPGLRHTCTHTTHAAAFHKAAALEPSGNDWTSRFKKTRAETAS
eukprot:352891-Chlamydomonas_euryale.AAC.7